MSDRIQRSLIGTSLLVLALALGARLAAQPEAMEEATARPVAAAEPAAMPEDAQSANAPDPVPSPAPAAEPKPAGDPSPDPALQPEPIRNPIPSAFSPPRPVPVPADAASPAAPIDPPVAENAPAPLTAATPAAPAKPEGQAVAQRMISLNFQDAPLDQVLQLYSELTGRTMIKSPGVTATISLRGQTRLTEDEVKQAIESALALNNITLVPFDEKFFRVVHPPIALQEGLPIRFSKEEQARERDSMVSQVVELAHIEIVEASTILTSILHGYGKVQPLERTNALMITDTESNIRRAMELLAYLDRPLVSKVETRVYELHQAVAADVAARLNDLIAGQPTQPRRATTTIIQQAAQPAPPGVVRPPPQPAAVRTETGTADRGIVIGEVKVVADDRTNVLIVISDPRNFDFFDEMIRVLDRAVEPETLVKVYTLEYALADEIADLLNSLIGATGISRRAGASEVRTTGGRSTRPTSSTGGSTGATDARSQSIRDFIASQTARAAPPATGEPAGEGIGELSDETRILADLRSNSILMMGHKADLIVLEEVVKELDVMLAQVVIEAVIVEITLSDEVSYGIDWLQRSMQAYNETRAGPGGGIAIREPIASWGGGFLSGPTAAFRSGAEVGRDIPLSSGALSYYMTIENLNLDAIIRLAAKDSDARILSTPVILTTDNTEAKIIAGEERPIVTSTTITTGGNQTSAYEYKNIGVELTVKPHINPQRVVVMDVTQTADNVGEMVQIDGNEVPVVTKRELSANIAVEDRSTIVLGGLVSNADRTGRSKVPFLGDIPFLGRLFRADNRSRQRTELLVLLTPYVVRTPHEARAETRRIHDATEAGTSRWFEQGFTDSDLARRKREDLPAARDRKLPPRIEEFLDSTSEPAPARGGARTIVVPQTPHSAGPSRAPSSTPASRPPR